MEQTTAALEAAGIRPLTDPERERLVECEGVIKAGLGTFIEVGKCLAEINESRLYRETHKDFKRYCKDVWDLGKTTAEQKINGYKVVNLLEEKMPAIGGHFKNERQLRPLTRLKGEDDLLQACGILQEKLAQNPKTKLTGAMVTNAVKAVKGEVTQRKRTENKKQLESTQLVSKLFKNQYQVMVDIISEEQAKGWHQSSKTEVVKWLKDLVKIAEAKEG